MIFFVLFGLFVNFFGFFEFYCFFFGRNFFCVHSLVGPFLPFEINELEDEILFWKMIRIVEKFA